MKTSLLFLFIIFVAHNLCAQSSSNIPTTGPLQSSLHQSIQQQAETDFNIGGAPSGSIVQYGNTNLETLDKLVAENNKFGRVITTDNNREQILNRVYLFDSNEGLTRIYTDNGRGYKIPDANFNLSSNQLEVAMGNNQVFNFDLSRVAFFEKENRKFVFYDKTNTVYEVLVDNIDVKYFKGFEVEIKSASNNPLTNEVIKPAYAIKTSKYYLQFGEDIVELPNSKRKFLNMLPAKKDALEKFIKDNKLDFSKEESLKVILNYYTSI